MARWQRHARLALGVFLVALVTAVLVVMRQRAPQTAPAPVNHLDPKAVSQTIGGEVIQLKGDKRDVQIEFSAQLTYEDKRQKLVDFKATINDRGGRSFVIRGKEAWIGADLSSYDVRGGVSLDTSDGLHATTDHAFFTEAEGILKGPGPVQFQRENMSGSGVGFTYDRQQDALWLLDKAVIRFAATTGKTGMDVTSGTAGYSRAQRYVRFERAVRMNREGQQIDADASTVFLQATIDEPDRIELRGQSRITGSGSTGSLQTMQARDINLDYAADGRTLEQAVLAGQSSILMGQKEGSAGQELSGEYIDLSLAADGSVTRLAGRDAVKVVLPVVADAPSRTITSTTLSASGEAGKGLTAMIFEGTVEYREAASEASEGRVAKAPALDARLAASGTIDSAEFRGGFTFEDGRLTATSTDAQYQVTKGVIVLSSTKGAAPPHVADSRVTIDAPAIEVTLSPRKMTASGGVGTVLSAGRRQTGERGTTLLKESEPVNIRADDLVFDEDAGKGVYTGKAWLWQGDTSIKADAITLDDRQGDLLATGNVVSVLPIAGKQTEGGTATSIGKGGEFHFEDSERRASFSKDAILDGVQGNLRAERIELFLAPKDNALDRLEAQGAPVTVIIEKREATGTKLTYQPAREEYVLVGSPVKFIESCHETSGRTLTFYKASDRILVDGNEEQRTQTKGGAKCPK